MKSEEKDDGEWGDPDYDNVGQEAYDDYMAEQRKKLEDTGQSEAQRINFLKPSKPKKGNVPTALPKKLTKSAEETIFKAISLKLDLMKDVKPRDYSHGKCVNCGKKMNHQQYMAADHSLNNPKEGEKVCPDCFDKEQI